MTSHREGVESASSFLHPRSDVMVVTMAANSRAVCNPELEAHENQLSLLLFTCIRVLLTGSSTAHASTNGYVVPFFRGSANSEPGCWESFPVPVGAPGNLPNIPGATTVAVLPQSDTNALKTASGNIYNLTGLAGFHGGVAYEQTSHNCSLAWEQKQPGVKN